MNQKQALAIAAQKNPFFLLWLLCFNNPLGTTTELDKDFPSANLAADTEAQLYQGALQIIRDKGTPQQQGDYINQLAFRVEHNDNAQSNANLKY